MAIKWTGDDFEYDFDDFDEAATDKELHDVEDFDVR
jgi:hypothetical protein